MSQILQVLVTDQEMQEIRKQAEMEGLPVGKYVRRTLGDAAARRTSRDAAAKIAAIRKATLHSFPTVDIDEMNREIEHGYQG